MALSIIRHIEKHGLDATVEKFKLKKVDYGHKILLKYNQIESSYTNQEVCDSRGLILEKDTWKVMSLSFRKFFNNEESFASKIDWGSAVVLEKCDGTMIQLYWDWVQKQWCVGTTGTAEGEGEVNNKPDTSFAKLFWDTFEKYNVDKKLLNPERVYVFELMTPYNLVVAPHKESKLALLACRNIIDLTEHSYSSLVRYGEALGLPVVKAFDLNVNNAGQLKKNFENMPYYDEGYVVLDGNFNRVKLKNPAYVAAHHLKAKTGHHHIMGVVKSNEVEEFGATFPERREELFDLKKKFDYLIFTLESAWEELQPLKPKNITAKEKKRFAMAVFEVAEKYKLGKNFTGIFFGLQNGSVESVREFIMDYDNKKLYNLLRK